MTNRKAQTMQLSGNDYAKVAERLKLFRTDFPRSKIETAFEYEVDKSVIFTVWIWKDKADYIEVLKEVKDATIARGSSDSNGNARGEVGTQKKDFEKLETIALGRALAMMGYLASGEIASFEEMEEFDKFRTQQQEQQVAEAVAKIKAAKSNEDLNKVVQSISGLLKFQDVIDAGKAKRAELAEAAAKKDEQKEPPKPKEKPSADSKS